MQQTDLFETPAAPAGFVYQTDLVSADEEACLVAMIGNLPLQEAQYKAWRAKRRIVSYGGSYDFNHNRLLPGGSVPDFLHPLRARVAGWLGLPPDRLRHALITEYRPGTQLGWHRDVPDFETVAGVSLLAPARMRFRRYPPRGGTRAAITLRLDPRSVYALTGEARWGWQHAISPTASLRYSITFRTFAGRAAAPHDHVADVRRQRR